MSIAGLGTYGSSTIYQGSVTKSRSKELPTGTELLLLPEMAGNYK